VNDPPVYRIATAAYAAVKDEVARLRNEIDADTQLRSVQVIVKFHVHQQQDGRRARGQDVRVVELARFSERSARERPRERDPNVSHAAEVLRAVATELKARAPALESDLSLRQISMLVKLAPNGTARVVIYEQASERAVEGRRLALERDKRLTPSEPRAYPSA
jgi:hypothetical protein